MTAPLATPVPVFIVGAPRSGTTMLQYILDDLPGLCMPTGESHYLIPLYRSQATFDNLDTRAGMRRLLETILGFNPIFLHGDLHGMRFDVEALTETFLAEKRTTVRDVVAGVFEKNAAGLGKQRWGDKTPYYALHLDKLADWWPDAKFIHLIRDGRDVALSLFGRRHDFSAYNMYYAAQYWQKYVDVCREQGALLGADRYLELRYEDVLDDQTRAMQTVCDFIGEPYRPGSATAAAAGESAQRLRTADRTNQGKWRSRLSPWQLRVFESEAGRTLDAAGYPLTTVPRRLPLPIRVLYRLHNDLSVRFNRVLGHNRSKLRFTVRPAPQPSNMTKL